MTSNGMGGLVPSPTVLVLPIRKPAAQMTMGGIIALPPDFAPAWGKIMRQPQIRCAEVFARLSDQMKVTDDPLEARFRYNWP